MDQILNSILRDLHSLNHEAGLKSEFESRAPLWLQGFARSIDSSPYPLREWLLAHDAFLEWGIRHKRTLTLDQRQEYLLCCIEGMKEPTGGLPLRDVLHYYLETNGMD